MKTKVLLVTETPPETPNGFGVTLKCLLKETNHDVVFTDADFKEHGSKLGYRLAQVPYHTGRKYYMHYKLGKIPEWRGNYSKLWLKSNLKNAYGKVYAFVYSERCLNFAHWISLQLKIPLIIHLADHCESFEKPEVVNLLKDCTSLICITKEMKEKYQGILGKKNIEVIHNGAEKICFDIPQPSSAPFSENNPFVLCFIGGLFYHLHGDCIEDIADAFTIIREKKPFLRFDLYGQRQPPRFCEQEFKGSGIIHHGVVMPLEKKNEIMTKAHCFVIPSTFNFSNHRNYRFSFPTKIPELIASGRPILSYGPEDTATNHFLKLNKVGVRVHERSILKLADSLNSIIENYSDHIFESKRIRISLGKYFSAHVMRKKLHSSLNFS